MNWHWLLAGARHLQVPEGESSAAAWTLEDLLGETNAPAPAPDLVWLIGGNGAVGVLHGQAYFSPHHPGATPNGVDRALIDCLAKRSAVLPSL